MPSAILVPSHKTNSGQSLDMAYILALVAHTWGRWIRIIGSPWIITTQLQCGNNSYLK